MFNSERSRFHPALKTHRLATPGGLECGLHLSEGTGGKGLHAKDFHCQEPESRTQRRLIIEEVN
jgi:hypothetical protein